MNYTTAIETLNGKLSKKVDNNTFIIKDYEKVNLLLHGHTILTFIDKDQIVIDSCGYESNVTKDRINAFLPENFPFRVVTRQREFKWQSMDGNFTLYPFINGQLFVQNKNGTNWEGI